VADPKGGTDLKQFRFSHTVRVRWAESDIQRVVFNGHYLTYFDIGLTEYLRAMFDGSQQKLHGLFSRSRAIRIISSAVS